MGRRTLTLILNPNPNPFCFSPKELGGWVGGEEGWRHSPVRESGPEVGGEGFKMHLRGIWEGEGNT